MSTKFLLFVASIMLALTIVFWHSPAHSAVSYDSATKTMTVTGPNDIEQANLVTEVVESVEVDTAVISGPGGIAYVGMYLGAIFHGFGIDVVIPEGRTCVSACAFAALGGKTITLEDGAQLWFHQFYTPGIPALTTPLEYTESIQGTTLDIVEYIGYVGYAFTFYQDIHYSTNYCVFLVVTDTDVLDYYKTDESDLYSFFPEPYGTDQSTYFIHSNCTETR